jgi:hypothetical protein
MPFCVGGFFDSQEYRRRRHIIVEIEGAMVRKLHTEQCRAMPCTEAKLTNIKQVSHLNVTVDRF